MATSRSSIASRPFLIAVAIFGLFLLFDIALFGWMIFRSLSEREIEKVLLETREEAETIAQKIASQVKGDGEDLYTAVARERETQTYIDSTLRQREIVSDVQIFDKQGRLVFRRNTQDTIIPPPSAGPPELGSAEVPPEVKKEQSVKQFQFDARDIEVPIGDLGVVKIGISGAELSKRIEVLRRDLIRQASVVGVVTIALLLSAYLGIWLLLRRARRAEEVAAEAERMAYIGTLASGLAHEIRNPLNSLNLNMQMLEEEMGEASQPSTGRRLVSITRSEISRLERLVTDFLSYAKPRPLELEEMPLAELLERVAGVLAGEVHRRQARLTIDDRSGGALVQVDAAQMRQLLLNLVQNALSATEESPRAPVIKLGVYRQGPKVVLEVADNGVGIPEDELPRIFDLFYSTRKGGTGLGLAIVQRIARAHGARVEVRSTLGVGTAVRVHLAAVAAQDEPAHEPDTVERVVGA